MVSLGIHREDVEKQNSKVENLLSIKIGFPRKLSQGSYQWAHTGEISKLKYENNKYFFLQNQ